MHIAFPSLTIIFPKFNQTFKYRKTYKLNSFSNQQRDELPTKNRYECTIIFSYLYEETREREREQK